MKRSAQGFEPEIYNSTSIEIIDDTAEKTPYHALSILIVTVFTRIGVFIDRIQTERAKISLQIALN